MTEAVDAIVGPMFAYFRTHPSAVQLWFAGRDSTLSQLSHTFDESWAQQLWSFLVERGFIMEDTPALVVRLAFEAGDRVFDVAFQRSPKGDDETVVELRRMVTAYLQTYAPQALDR
nr:hypothetical protein [Mycobacteroides chelonae]